MGTVSGEVDSGGGESGEERAAVFSVLVVGDGRGLACAGVQGERLGRPELATEGEEVRGLLGELLETGENVGLLGELLDTGEDFGQEAAAGL